LLVLQSKTLFKTSHEVIDGTSSKSTTGQILLDSRQIPNVVVISSQFGILGQKVGHDIGLIQQSIKCEIDICHLVVQQEAFVGQIVFKFRCKFRQHIVYHILQQLLEFVIVANA